MDRDLLSRGAATGGCLVEKSGVECSPLRRGGVISRSYLTLTPASSPRQAVRCGLRDAFGVPALVLAASYIGFGALVRESGLRLWHGLLSTATGWALPGQIALVELYYVGAPLLAITGAVALTNARLLPMVVTLMPMLRAPGRARWQYYCAAHLIAVTGWAQALRVCPSLAPPQRLPYFVGFAIVLWTATLLATAGGFALSGEVPRHLSMGLVFLNPIYFMLVFAADVHSRPRVLALLFGALAGPPLFLLSADWGLLLTGLGAGTLAILLGRRRQGV